MNHKKGFTLLEVALFLALSGLLVVGIISGTSRSIAKQRYNNASESFADFLKGLYSQVFYTQNSVADYGGRSELAIYGKLITFGEDDAEPSRIHIYTVIGNTIPLNEVGDLGNTSPLKALYYANADVFVEGATINELTYLPDWGSTIEDQTGGTLKKSLLIIRSPLSGDIFSYTSPVVVPVQQKIAEMSASDLLTNYLPVFSGVSHTLEDDAINLERDDRIFKAQDLDFCLDSEDRWAAGNYRRNIRVIANGHNSSAVKTILDSSEGEEGYRCEE